MEAENRAKQKFYNGLIITALCFLVPTFIALYFFKDTTYVFEFTPLLIMGVASGILTIKFLFDWRKEVKETK